MCGANAEIGKYGYYLANASENTISGGFISGGPANMTVIRSVGKRESDSLPRVSLLACIGTV